MQVELVITLILLGVSIVSGVVAIVVALVRGDMKLFIEKMMIEAEQKDLTGEEKLKYVLEAVKKKHKVLEIVMNVQKFVEHIIVLSKQINAK